MSSVWVCVYIYIYIYLCVCVCVSVFVRACVRVCARACVIACHKGPAILGELVIDAGPVSEDCVQLCDHVTPHPSFGRLRKDRLRSLPRRRRLAWGPLESLDKPVHVLRLLMSTCFGHRRLHAT